MVAQAAHTARSRLSPAGMRASVGAPQVAQKRIVEGNTGRGEGCDAP